jgi:hypothetical protein
MFQRALLCFASGKQNTRIRHSPETSECFVSTRIERRRDFVLLLGIPQTLRVCGKRKKCSEPNKQSVFHFASHFWRERECKDSEKNPHLKDFFVFLFIFNILIKMQILQLFYFWKKSNFTCVCADVVLRVHLPQNAGPSSKVQPQNAAHTTASLAFF